ncbi:thymidylate synthase [Nodularia phage vB_NpeS-2AV2]|uniref:Thymidylate synthase n=1 Tax=Nodularia phage vB_NpeS-2AV2 TaxID=1777122 RepID=A0A1L2BX50_9CAUD|nr:thymidylate synthase [Nodularia phage vB_NpeS-2AV2]ALY07614.1 thymidylate synthase [Nodularia phage vB_NpeS-2AV2]
MVQTNNSVQLLGYYGGDKRVCLSAWQSTTEELGLELPDNIHDRVDVIFQHIAVQKKKSPFELLQFLAANNHSTPFEKAILDFQITADLASHIHSLKHRLSAINSESARYKEFQQDKFYIPDDWKSIKVSETFLFNSDDIPGDLLFTKKQSWQIILTEHTRLSFELYHACIADLEPILGRKRAKESARYFLGYNTQLNFDWQMNFRSFVNIQQLRNDSHAQREIHQITNTMLYLVETLPGNPFEYCLKAFNLKSDPEFCLIRGSKNAINE